MIPYARQDIDEADIQSVVNILRGDWITQGPTVPAFEEEMARMCGADHAVAVNSATSALHVACLALDLQQGGLVWTVPNTFVASANCALYCGASVDFVDIDPETWCMDASALSAKLEATAALGAQMPDIIIPVHFGGQSCDMSAIGALARQYGFKIIEDASHAVGAQYRQKPVGSGHFSDVTVFSFHPAKIITTGEGGLALTNNPVVGEKMRSLRSHGVTRDESAMERPMEGPWYYEMMSLGFNYRMTDIAAALGITQTARLEDFIQSRNALAHSYDAAFQGTTIGVQSVPPDCLSSRHLYQIRVPAYARASVFQSLRDRGVGVNVHYIPVHLQPWYRRLGFSEGYCPESEKHYSQAISLPMFATLGHSDQQQVIAAVLELAAA